MSDEPKQDVIEPETGESAAPEPKMLTQDEVNAIVAKEKAKVKAQYEKAESDRLQAIEEQKRLEALEGEEKLKEKHRMETKQLQDQLSEARRDLAIANARSKLSSMGLDPDFAENLIGADDSVTEANITRFGQMVESMVAKRVQANRQHGPVPDPSAGQRPMPEEEEMDRLRRLVGLR
jgi:hypothetical protein